MARHLDLQFRAFADDVDHLGQQRAAFFVEPRACRAEIDGSGAGKHRKPVQALIRAEGSFRGIGGDWPDVGCSASGCRNGRWRRGFGAVGGEDEVEGDRSGRHDAADIGGLLELFDVGQAGQSPRHAPRPGRPKRSTPLLSVIMVTTTLASRSLSTPCRLSRNGICAVIRRLVARSAKAAGSTFAVTSAVGYLKVSKKRNRIRTLRRSMPVSTELRSKLTLAAPSDVSVPERFLILLVSTMVFFFTDW